MSLPNRATVLSLLAALVLATLALGGLLLGGLSFGDLARAEEEIDWKTGEVARVADRSLTWDDLCRSAVEHLAPLLLDRKSPAFANYATAFFDRILEAHCAKHDIEITAEQRAQAWADLDAQVRAKRGVSLLEAMQERLVPRRAQERDLLRGLRIAALTGRGVDAGAAWEAAEMRRALATADHPEPEDLGSGIVGLVDGVPITDVEFGDRLLSYAGPRLGAEILDRACRTLLVESAGAVLDDEGIEAELAYLAELAPVEARFDPEEVWRQFTVREGHAREESWSRSQVRASAWARSMLGLIRKYRLDARPAAVRSAWEGQRNTLYGPHVGVLEVAVEFQTAGDVFAAGSGRTRADARAIARTARRLLEKGTAADAIAAALNAANTPGVDVTRRRLYPTDRNRLLFDQVQGLADGETATLVETLSAWHALRREGAHPAPAFEEVEKVVRERLARKRAKAWLEQGFTDPRGIRRRWPPPQLR